MFNLIIQSCSFGAICGYDREAVSVQGKGTPLARLPVDNGSPSSCHHGPDSSTGVEQGEFETGPTLGVQVCDVGLLWGTWGRSV